MAQLHFSDEILMAFADGEVDEQVAAAVEKAMASDLTVARRVAEFLRSRHLIRSAFPNQTTADIPPELLTTVQAQIERFESNAAQAALPEEARPSPSKPLARRYLPTALAAGLAALALATGGYLAGRQDHETSSSGPIGQLGTPEVRRALSEGLSGQDQNLSIGRMRVISTFRIANGSLCREFKLQVLSGSSNAVACRERDWVITFATTSAAANDAYVPSDGADLMASYLQNVGAGAPLLGSDESNALNDARNRR